MNIIEAIKIAIDTKRNIISNHGYWIGNTAVAPGPINPEYLLDNIGDIDQNSLLGDNWEVEEEKLTITWEQFNAVTQHFAIKYEVKHGMWIALGGKDEQ